MSALATSIVAGLSTRSPERFFQAAPCYWDAIGADCDHCSSTAVSAGLCQNTCLTPDELPRCRAAGKTYGECDELDGNAVACLATYQASERGTAACWYDAGECRGCTPIEEHQGKCANDR